MNITKISAFCALCVVVLFLGCDMPSGSNNGSGGDGNGGNNSPAVYKDFYNYPIGRKDPGGTLEIRNTVASPVLLFTDSVSAANYIGTADSLASIKVKLPEEKFYTIVAVDKAIYEEKTSQASQFSNLTYYSPKQAFNINVSPTNTYGGGTWMFNNNTSYWVQIKKSDNTSTYAVLAPGAQRVSIPVALNESYDFVPYFSKELKYGGKVIALVDTTDRSQSDTASTTTERPTFTSTINNTAVGTSIKPAVLVKNNSGKTVRVYYSSSQMTNGSPGGDFVVLSGDQQMLTGFATDNNTNEINFYSNAWGGVNKKVLVDMVMQESKVYVVSIATDGTAITVKEEDSSIYFQ